MSRKKRDRQRREKKLAKAAAELGGIRSDKYYHGGIGGLPDGALLLPPSVTGHKCASDYGAGDVHSRDRVYITNVLEAAMMFAALHPDRRGFVYQVEPIGEIEHDPDCDTENMSFAVPSARVIRVAFILSPMRRMKILRELGVNRELW